jgi:hypothetical protein
MKRFKKIYSIALLVFAVLITSNGNAKEINSFQKELKVEQSDDTDLGDISIGIKLEIGRKSRNCKGFGICKFTVTISIKPSFKAFAAKSGGLRLEMTNDAYNELRDYFDGDIIIIEEDFEVGSDVTKKLDLGNGYTIKKGEYRITLNENNKYEVTF